MDYSATVEATPNIALIKYWGKRDEKLKLPVNSSISLTLAGLVTRTTVSFSEKYGKDEFKLNGRAITGKELANITKVLDRVRVRARTKLRAHVVSRNYFPEGAGLASSASGFAALACAASKALRLKLPHRELSIIARTGSGSASRSVMGGVVEWMMGKKKDGSDSYAVQLHSERHWPELRDVIGIVEKGKKKVSSRDGMRSTVKTSRLFKQRLKEVPRRSKALKLALRKKNLPLLLQATMEDSDSMHACMADSKPPIIYMNADSLAVVIKVHELNYRAGRIIAGYTFDAGPNAHIITTSKHEKKVVEMLRSVRGVKKVIACKAGDGPKYLK